MKKLPIILTLFSFLVLSCGASEASDENKDSGKEEKTHDSAKLTTSQENESEIKTSNAAEDNFSLESLLDINSAADLKNRYPDAEIIEREQWFAEGTVKKILTVLYPDTKKELSFIWIDEEAKKGLSSITVDTKGSPWMTKQGIMIGTTVAELEALNGMPFNFSGFGWDYAGGCNFKGGALDYDELNIILDLKPEDYKKEGYVELLGDRIIETDSPELDNFDPIVVEISLFKEL